MNTNSNLEFRKIKSLQFLYEVNENGTIFRNIKSKKQSKIILDHHHSSNGYYTTFVNIKGVVKRVMIHSVVAECWLGEKPENMKIDHIDRNPHNNHYSNLRYVSHSQQMKNRVLGEHVINQAIKNCYNYTIKYVAKAVKIKNDEEELYFDSMSSCARYLGNKFGENSEHFRTKFKKRRKHIRGYDIYYLNAETRHASFTEQGMIHI